MGSTVIGAALGPFFNPRGVLMRVYPATGSLIFTGLVLIVSMISCSPTGAVRGRVVDADSGQPIKNAAVAIKWYTESTAQPSAKPMTIDAFQALSDDTGVFQIPKHPDKQYILGVYKKGYICWSSRDIFSVDPATSHTDKYRQRKNYRIMEGMEIKLEPLSNSHPKDLHAGFTMMVAGESTDTDQGPFHQAIQAEYQLWRQNLRKDFQKQVGEK